MRKYLYILHESATAMQGLSPAEIQGIIQKYKAWSQSMAQRGLLAGGHKLEDGTGRVLKGSEVTDGPYVEAKEVIGGLFVVNADSYEQAVEYARTCPHADFGTIEIRAVEVV